MTVVGSAPHPSRPVSSVVIVMAMEAEAAPLVATLGLQATQPPAIAPPAPCTTYSGRHGGLQVHVVLSGKDAATGVDNVGTVPSALCTYLALQAFRPDLCISAGTAGGFSSRGAAIADVYLSTKVYNHDRRIALPGFEAYGYGEVECTSCPRLCSALGLKSGVVSSGNSLDYTDKCWAIMQAKGAHVKEMEAAAVAWSAQLFATPMFCLKAVTDLVDGERRTEEEFMENLHRAAKALQDIVPRVLDFLDGKQLDQL